MMNLRQMEVFYAVMKTGSVTSAARLLNVSQPAVSGVLKQCETRLKIALFARVAGRLEPTAEAHAIMPDVAAIFERVSAVSRLTQDLAGGRLGTLSIAAASPVANGFLSKAVASYISTHRGVRFTVQCLSSPQVLDRVVKRDVEIGIVNDLRVAADEVRSERLGAVELVCVMRENHPLALHDDVPFGSLAGHPLITYLPQARYRVYVDAEMSKAKIVPNIVVQVTHSTAGLMAAYHGAGIAIIDRFVFDYFGLPGLVSRPLRPRIELNTCLIQLEPARLSQAMQGFVTHLRQSIRGYAWAA